MDFSLGEEQTLLQDTLRRFLSKEYTFESRRAHVASADGFSRDTWRQLAELGILGLTIPEADGGMGGDAFATSIVMEAPGLPYLAALSSS